MTELILVGGGGHCISCIDVIERCSQYSIAGILDMPEQVGKSILGYHIVGTDADLQRFAGQYEFLITVGQVKSGALRKKIYDHIKAVGGRLATIVAATAYVSKHSSVGEGSIVMHGAAINAQVEIGANCIINTGTNIEHDCTIGKHVHVSTHAVINGGCTIGDESFIGSNAVTVHGIQISKQAIIGAGAVVHKSVTQPGTYAGNPLRAI